MHPRAPGTKSPDCARSCASPSDWSSRVLPPEFGPVTSTVVSCRSVWRSHGTALHALGEQERIEEAQEHARLAAARRAPAGTRRAPRPAPGRGSRARRGRTRSRRGAARAGRARPSALEHGVDEARHHLAVAEAVAAHEELDLRQPPAARPSPRTGSATFSRSETISKPRTRPSAPTRTFRFSVARFSS